MKKFLPIVFFLLALVSLNYVVNAQTISGGISHSLAICNDNNVSTHKIIIHK